MIFRSFSRNLLRVLLA